MKFDPSMFMAGFLSTLLLIWLTAMLKLTGMMEFFDFIGRLSIACTLFAIFNSLLSKE